MKKFVTLFPYATNQTLSKDVGMIPYFLGKSGQYETKVVSYHCTTELFEKNNLGIFNNTIDDQLHATKMGGAAYGLKYEAIPFSGSAGFLHWGILRYLIEEGKQIDILNLYHFNALSFCNAAFYKIINKKGKVYLKADLNNSIKFRIYKSRRFILYNFLVWLFLRAVDYISVETPSGYRNLKSDKNIPLGKTYIIPNGVNDIYIDSLKIEELPLNQRDNIILFVGRFGVPFKNTELILDFVEKEGIPEGIKLVFMGPMLESIKQRVDRLFCQNNELKAKITFLGNITDKRMLYETYAKAKVFCLPSKKGEGSPISIAEALNFGNYLLLSKEVGTASDFIASEEIGQQFNPHDIYDFKRKVDWVINNITYIDSNYPIIKSVAEKYKYSKITHDINSMLQCNNQK